MRLLTSKLNRILVLFTMLLCSFLFISSQISAAPSTTNNVPSCNDSTFQYAMQNFRQIPTESMQILETCANHYKSIGDTTRLVECLRQIGNIYRLKLNHVNSFDYYWNALKLAAETSDPIILEKIYHDVGEGFSFFHKEKEAKKYLTKALEYSKINYTGDQETGQNLISRYYTLALLSNQFGKHDIAQMYLDSCFVLSDEIKQDSIKKAYLYAESGYIQLVKENHAEAERMLLKVTEQFEQIKPRQKYHIEDVGYLVVIYNILGDVYYWQGNIKMAASTFEKGLEAVEKYKTHIGLKADFLYKLSDIYYRLGDNDKAYLNLLQSKTITDTVYGARSANSFKLFEIKDQYREELNRKNLELAENKKQLYEKERRLFQIKIFLTAFVFVIGLGILMWQNYLQKKKHRIQENNDKAMLELKNKELTSYTLQAIEQDEVVSELIDYVKNNLPDKEGRIELLNRAQKNRSNYWTEFNTRFLSVNQEFYERLGKKFPSLTQSDLKHCALIKLNFSAKEIAHLLSISVSSVHMSRYRIRKKMNLDREVNLGNFIASI